jgi:Asp-tRNA(Asn)/Glu-tRNA(Gln) amidotransferase A subunit family amidase
MTDERELALTPAWKLAEMVAAKQVSPVELVELCLRRIERIDPKVGAFITVAAEQAREAARAAETKLARMKRGPSTSSGRAGKAAAGNAGQGGGEQPFESLRDSLPPLFGVPVSLKDIEATKGIRTTLGSRIFADTVPENDSVVAERVRACGAVIIGKTNTPEIAIHLETITDNDIRGPCNNPWDLTRTTGGSSGGAAAALVSGMCPLAVGSDGGGSIRIPAAFCGVFGVKPTQGRVPRARGLGRPDPNQFAQSGPMSNTVLDSAILLQALAGPHPSDPQPYLREPGPDFVTPVRGVMGREASSPLKGLRAAWSPDLGHAPVDPEMAHVCETAARALESLGAAIESPDIHFSADLPQHFWNIFGANAYLQYGHLLDDPAKASLLGPSARTALERGKAITGHAYAQSLRVVNELRVYVDSLFEKYDLLLTPTTAIPAFDPRDRPTQVAGQDVHAVNGFYPYTFPFNMTQHPAASIPCGFVDGAVGKAHPYKLPSPSATSPVSALQAPAPTGGEPGPSSLQPGDGRPSRESAGADMTHPRLPAGLQVVGHRGDDVGVLLACAAFEMARPWSGKRPPMA